MPLGPGAVRQRRIVDGDFVEVLRLEDDAGRNTYRERGGRALSYGRLYGYRALYDVGGGVGLTAGERQRLSVLDVVGHFDNGTLILPKTAETYDRR